MSDIAEFAELDGHRARRQAQGRPDPAGDARPVPGLRPRRSARTARATRAGRARTRAAASSSGRARPARRCRSPWRRSSSRPGRTAKPVTGFKGRSGKSFRARLALQQSEEGKWRVEFDEPWARRAPSRPRRSPPPTEGAPRPRPPPSDRAAAAAPARPSAGRRRASTRRRPPRRAASCSRRRSSARSFALASSITSKSEARRGLGEEVLEADRVDHVGVGAQLGEDERALDPPADLALLALLDRGLRRRVVDLRRDALAARSPARARAPRGRGCARGRCSGGAGCPTTTGRPMRSLEARGRRSARTSGRRSRSTSRAARRR